MITIILNLTSHQLCLESIHGSTEATFAFTFVLITLCIQDKEWHHLQRLSKSMQKDRNNGKWKKSSMTKPIGAKKCSSSNGKVFLSMKQLGNLWRDFRALLKCSEIIGSKHTIHQSLSPSQITAKSDLLGPSKNQNTISYHL